MSTTTNQTTAKNEYFNQYTNFVFAYLQAVRKHTKGPGVILPLLVTFKSREL